MSIDATLTITRIKVLRKHICVISPHTGFCFECRALKRYRDDAEWKRANRGGWSEKRNKKGTPCTN